jgi:surfeit locus 1 family protein
LSTLRLRLFVLLAVVMAAGCIRLGFWQISRLHQRRARNALVIARQDSAIVDFAALPPDSATTRFRRVRVSGTPDYAHELIWAARTHRGSPGVNILTPVRVAGRDTAVIVNRGWLYSPDGATFEEAKWHEHDTTFVGYVDEYPSPDGLAYSTRPNVIAHLGYGIVAKTLPYPVAKTYIVMTGDSVMAVDRIARLTVPPLDEGPHFSYAVQWFGFALVALGGAGFVIKQSRSSGGPRDENASTGAPPIGRG